MLTQIGQRRESNFSEPIGMLEDCHKRIQYFLGTLVRLAEAGKERLLNEDERAALQTALRYFREAAPKHTADEEESLFPRLRRINMPQVRELFAKVDRLEADHRRADEQHSEVDAIGRSWLANGCVDPQQGVRLALLLDSLSDLYREHIPMEETEVFPVAKNILSAPAQQSMGQEMARRRGVVL